LLEKAPLCNTIGFWNRNNGNLTLTASLDGEIRDGCHHMPVRVYFEDTDSGQIVYHANFLRFMERGRTNYLRLLGTNQQALLKEAENDAPGFAFVVRSMTIDFLRPAILDDLLDIVTVPQEVKGASIDLLQECRRADDLLVTARVRVAFICGGKALRIPKALRLAMEGHK
jgi:acyl-CoA thioester hydrolase